jgi:hypothetical protein
MPLISGADASERSRHGHNNAQRLFGVLTIPTLNQIKNVVDGVIAAVLLPVFRWVCSPSGAGIAEGARGAR